MISIFDIFKYSIGPSSSHTTAPMNAGFLYRRKIFDLSNINSTDRLRVELYGSLSYTGSKQILHCGSSFILEIIIKFLYNKKKF